MKFTDSSSITLTLSQAAENQYTFEIEDTGPGISAQDKQQLFNNFTQGRAATLKGGTGLNRLGEGTQFTLTLPKG